MTLADAVRRIGKLAAVGVTRPKPKVKRISPDSLLAF
jgi:hypothetical protein